MRISDWSSDVCSSDLSSVVQLVRIAFVYVLAPLAASAERADRAQVADIYAYATRLIAAIALRSEEHTSELQSLMRISYAVFCLKKKKNKVKKKETKQRKRKSIKTHKT